MIKKKQIQNNWLEEYGDGGKIRGTKLTEPEQMKYDVWRSMLPKNLQYEGDYDLKGFYKENPNWTPNDPNSHMTDKYKLPNHPTFSNESMYFNLSNKDSAGYWQNNMYIPYNPSIKDTVREFGPGGEVTTKNYVPEIPALTKETLDAINAASPHLTKSQQKEMDKMTWDKKSWQDKTKDYISAYTNSNDPRFKNIVPGVAGQIVNFIPEVAGQMVTSALNLTEPNKNYGKYVNPNNNVAQNIIETGVPIALDMFNSLPLAKPLVKGLDNIAEKVIEGTSKTFPEVYKLNPYAEKLNNPNTYYRGADRSSLNDALNSGYVRSNPSGSSGKQIGNISLNRPTSFPSFNQGEVLTHYLPEEGGYIYASKEPMLKRGDVNPVTGNTVKGSHFAHRPIDLKTGNVINELPLDKVEIYKGKPNWLTGYEKIDKKLVGKSDISAPDDSYIVTKGANVQEITRGPIELDYNSELGKSRFVEPKEPITPKRTNRLKDIRNQKKQEYDDYKEWFKENKPKQTFDNNWLNQYK